MTIEEIEDLLHDCLCQYAKYLEKKAEFLKAIKQYKEQS